MGIYTKSGDKGITGIFGGERVAKDDIRIEANGCVDELNSVIGIIRFHLKEEHKLQLVLFELQTLLMAVMSNIATPYQKRDENPNKLPEDMVIKYEKIIDELLQNMGDDRYFILPGGNAVSSYCHLARTVARRAERRLWTLNRQDTVNPEILKLLNRLSDMFFVMAKYAMYEEGKIDDRWKPFIYKRKR